MSEITGNYAFCKISAASVRQLPNHSSTMISQVLFGEHVQIIRRKNKQWSRVVCVWDEVEGWIDMRQFYADKSALQNEDECDSFALELIHGAISNQRVIPISIGSNLRECDGINFKMPFGKFQYSGQIVNLDQSRNSSKLLLNIAKRYLHAPYLMGGRSIGGIDASGFVQVVFKLIGFKLPRFANGQGMLGEDVGFLEQAKVGDLAFFQSKNGEIIHVGIIVEDNQIMHVDGMVRIDKIDQQGIYNLDTKRYSFKLRTIRRMLKFKNS